MYFLLTGVLLLAVIIGLFWLKDRLQSPLLARFVYSGLVARLAVIAAVFSVLGILIMLADFAESL